MAFPRSTHGRRSPFDGSLNNRIVVPFTLGVVVLAGAIALIAALSGYDAAEDQLRTRADAAHRLFKNSLEQRQRELAADTRLLAEQPAVARAAAQRRHHPGRGCDPVRNPRAGRLRARQQLAR